MSSLTDQAGFEPGDELLKLALMLRAACKLPDVLLYMQESHQVQCFFFIVGPVNR